MAYYPQVTRMLPLTTLRRERVLPMDGQVLVEFGARVEPQTIVARARVPGRYLILDVAQSLKVPPEAADQYIRPKPGQRVKAGQAVARRQVALGLLPRAVRAPQTGIVAAVGGGRLLLETSGQSIDLRAYLPGTVANVLPRLGVLVESVGALIQGVWGIGGEAFGVLKVLVERPDEPLRARSIDVASHGAVLVGGATMDRDALQQAQELQVRGIVVGSMDPMLIEMAEEMPFPIIATEGFGQAPMAYPIFQLLRTNDGREAAISGNVQTRFGAIRPEIVIPLPAGSAPPPPPPGTPVEAGAEVRVIRGPLVGMVGTVRHLPPQPVVLETGKRLQGAVVQFDDTGEQLVPLFNLELLG